MGSFGTILIVITLVAVVAAALSFVGSGRIYRGLGRSGAFSMDEPDGRRAPAPSGQAASAEAQAEIRQMLEAKSDRREARGQAPLDVDAEVAALNRPSTPRDASLREEVRQLVVARNERRARQGKAPLDMDEEIERQLRDLGV